MDFIFHGCEKSTHVDLFEGEVLRDTIDALQLEEWRNEMDEEIGAINQSLLTARAGGREDVGGKARAIRMWIRTVLGKIVHYKAEHRRLLNEAATTLQLALPKMISCSRMSFLFSNCYHTRLKERIRRGGGKRRP